MSQALTRRALVAAAPAAVIAATLPAIAGGDHADAALLALRAPWLALRAPWLATLADFNAALSAKSKIDEQIFARSASYPDFKDWTGSIADYSATCAAITAEREAIGARLGSDDADALEDETAAENGEVVEQIEALPARTLAGLAFKVEVSEEQNHGREELIDRIMADIKALAQGGLHA